MTLNIDPALSKLITRRFSAAADIGCCIPLNGLSGASVEVRVNGTPLLARRISGAQAMPGVDRQREYRILRRLAGSGLVPKVWGRNADWLLLAWQPGDMVSADSADSWLMPLIDSVVALHRQPPSGYRLQLLALLWRYWQRSQPGRRHPGWLRALRQLQQRREPHPLRLAPLHMDIHSGNLIAAGDRVLLIDWEYAGDGDIALELAAMIAGNRLSAAQRQLLVREYARQQQLNAATLQRQIARWQPWLALLATSWYELRWQQSGEQHFRALAADGWQRLTQY